MYTVEDNVDYEYAPADDVIPNVSDVIHDEFHIAEPIEQQPVYGFAIDNLRYENRDVVSERENAPNPREDEEFPVVEAIEEEPVYGFAVENPKHGNKKGSKQGSKRDSKFSKKPSAGTSPGMSPGEIELQNVRQNLRSTKGSKTPESTTNNPREQENMGYVEDTNDLYNEVGQHQRHSSEQGQHQLRPSHVTPNVYVNEPEIYAQVKTKKRDRDQSNRNQIKNDNPVPVGNSANSDVQVPRRPIPVETHQGAETGSPVVAPGHPVDFREFEDDDGNNNTTEAIYGNATIEALAVSLNEAVENPKPPRTLSRRKAEGETSDSDTSWWTDDEWSAWRAEFSNLMHDQ